MPDASLAAILSGQDPLAAQMVPGYLAAQRMQAALNPENPGGILGGIGKALTGFDSGRLQSDVQNVVNQRVGNQQNLAQLLAQPDPFGALATASPGQYSPLSGGTLLAGATPESVADARLKAAQGQFFGAKALEAIAGSQPPPANMYSAPQSAGHPGGGAPPAELSAALGNPRYPQPTDPMAAAANMSPAQRQAIMQNPQQRAAWLAKLRAAAGSRG